jgi:hypothetical protein
MSLARRTAEVVDRVNVLRRMEISLPIPHAVYQSLRLFSLNSISRHLRGLVRSFVHPVWEDGVNGRYTFNLRRHHTSAGAVVSDSGVPRQRRRTGHLERGSHLEKSLTVNCQCQRLT